jgi:hypothetical protein
MGERLCGGTPITTMNTPTNSEALPPTNCSRRCSPQLSSSETTAYRAVVVDADQDVIWTRDAQNNVIGYTITNPKPVAGMRHILDDGSLSALDVQIHCENSQDQSARSD